MKRVATIVTSVLLGVGLAVGPVSPAQADPGGSCTVQMPSTLVIAAPVTRFLVHPGGDCEANTLGWATWELVNPRTGAVVRELYYDNTDPVALDWYDDTTGFGTFVLDARGAFDIDINPLTQNEGPVVVKAASWSTMVVSRNHHSVTVTVGASYYNARHDRRIPWPGAAVEIQAAADPAGPWTTMATVTTGATGLASTALYAPSPRYWRALTPTTRSVFPRYSVPVWR